MAGFSKSARAGDVTAIYQHTDGVTTVGCAVLPLPRVPSKEATAVRNAEAGMAGTAQVLESGCKVSLGA